MINNWEDMGVIDKLLAVLSIAIIVLLAVLSSENVVIVLDFGFYVWSAQIFIVLGKWCGVIQ